MIINAFTYNGQVQLLHLHLQAMYKHVDQFWVIQGNRTFCGEEKVMQYYFLQIGKYLDISKYNIRFLPCDVTQFMGYYNLQPFQFLQYRNVTSWKVQHYIKQYWIQFGMQLYDHTEDCQIIFIISDLDQIVNMAKFQKIKTTLKTYDMVKLINYDFYQGKFNKLIHRNWIGYLKILNFNSILSKFKSNPYHKIQLMINPISTCDCLYIQGRGMAWHFSSVMRDQEIKRKLKSFSHNLDNRIQKLNVDNYVEDLTNNADIQNGIIFDVEQMDILPQMMEVILRYPYLIYAKTSKDD